MCACVRACVRACMRVFTHIIRKPQKQISTYNHSLQPPVPTSYWGSSNSDRLDLALETTSGLAVSSQLGSIFLRLQEELGPGWLGPGWLGPGLLWPDWLGPPAGWGWPYCQPRPRHWRDGTVSPGSRGVPFLMSMMTLVMKRLDCWSLVYSSPLRLPLPLSNLQSHPSCFKEDVQR